ncbi:transcriptional regulator CynR [Streptomyces triticagri]|uniref:Transcriptional regulator CynR n=1 Tax=Streptomyces triticagri TaxID=2293568 RepID=A0A372M1Q6_9ACTN|nr:transcriptional regulator CynR [Streptomyces triticagri]RFU84217.1 transcriptional regulator CynR [Streptomyces triticagri]
MTRTDLGALPYPSLIPATGPELRQLRCLIAVAECGSFPRAADGLGMSQPALWQEIGRLERAVGAELLDRGGRDVGLTDAGEVYAHHARRALRDLSVADRAVRGAAHRAVPDAAVAADLSRETVRLAVTPTFTAYLVGPLVAELRRRHPGLALTVQELPRERLVAGLLAGELDAGVALDGARAAGIAERALFTETLSLVVTAGDAGRVESRPVPARELERRQLALLSGDFATREHIDAYFAEQRVSPPVAVQADSIQALTELVRCTPELATVLPDAVTDDRPRLRPVPLDPPLPARRAVLLVRDGAHRSPAAEAFMDVAAEVVRDRGYAPA